MVTRDRRGRRGASHPLLFPFVHGQSGGLLQLTVPAARQSVWDNVIGSIETELGDRKEGYRQAALAHLTLLLIDVARLAGDVVGDLGEAANRCSPRCSR